MRDWAAWTGVGDDMALGGSSTYQILCLLGYELSAVIGIGLSGVQRITRSDTWM